MGVFMYLVSDEMKIKQNSNMWQRMTEFTITSQPALRKSASFDMGTKYAMCGLPVVAVPQYIFTSRVFKISTSLSSPRTSWNKFLNNWNSVYIIL